ncbi:serine hydrolase domain-containing protein [Maricaulis sp.]|uniref:serine hydrolase domain-containing protein n=1 Tax=Maricaulis sp. TaxID=1486257 RepID=UPI0026115ED1|nr:serine hydrolase domain-containing protein [Maricaulis sp.]
MKLQTFVQRALIAGAMALGISAAALADTGARERLADAFDGQVADGFTGYVIVIRNGEVVFENGAGSARQDASAEHHFDIAFSRDTQLDIASITKTVTGILAAEQIAAGHLDPQAPLDTYLDVAGSTIAQLTTHQLLTHSAGLVDILGDDHEAVSLDEIVRRAARTELLYEPGSTYRYSNLGYSLAAAVLERVTGQSYETLVMQTLSAHGAAATGYAEAYDPARSVLSAQGEGVIDLSWGGHAPGGNLIGNGGLVSSAGDMAAWLGAFSRSELVSEHARDLVRTPYIDETGEERSYYGYGLVVEQHDRLGTIYWHNGGSRHFNAHWRELPDQGVLIIALANQPPAAADFMVGAMQRALFLQ